MNRSIRTLEHFEDVQLHVEWRTSKNSTKTGQGRGNSGLYFMGRYEVQILDSYDNPIYPDGQAAALYGQMPPLVNASLPSGEWQSYDIVFEAPRFDKEGKLQKRAYVTVFHNGVLVQYRTPFLGPTDWRNLRPYEPHGAAPLLIQDHNSSVSFRNIWLRKLDLGLSP